VQGPSGPAGPQGPAGPGSRTITGWVDDDGHTLHGSGFTSVEHAVRLYQIYFPAGTWENEFAVFIAPKSVSPLAFAISSAFVREDGSGSFTVQLARTSDSVEFMFTAVEI